MQAARLHPIQSNGDITNSRQSTAKCDQTIVHLWTSREICDVQRYPPCGILKQYFFIYVDKRVLFKGPTYKLRTGLDILDWNEHVDRPVTSVTQHVRAQNPRLAPQRILSQKMFNFGSVSVKDLFLDPRYMIIIIYLIQTASKMMTVILMMIFNNIEL